MTGDITPHPEGAEPSSVPKPGETLFAPVPDLPAYNSKSQLSLGTLFPHGPPTFLIPLLTDGGERAGQKELMGHTAPGPPCPHVSDLPT
jgi:hypothetical protein